MAICAWQAAGGLSIRCGLGPSVPIFIADGQADPGIAANILLGSGVAIAEKIMPVLEVEGVLGAGLGESERSELGFDARLGIVYKFGG